MVVDNGAGSMETLHGRVAGCALSPAVLATSRLNG